MDIRMPDMNGFELAAILKKALCLQEYTHPCGDRGFRPYRRQQCLAAGCDDFIAKPFTIAAPIISGSLIGCFAPSSVVSSGPRRYLDLEPGRTLDCRPCFFRSLPFPLNVVSTSAFTPTQFCLRYDILGASISDIRFEANIFGLALLKIFSR